MAADPMSRPPVPSIVVPDDLSSRLREATEMLEQIVADRSVLDALPLDERTRLLNAAGDVYEPDVEARRRQIKAERRKQKADKAARDREVLTETGIRALRAKPVFTTPDAFAPRDVGPDAIGSGEIGSSEIGSGEIGPAIIAQAAVERHCYVCKQRYTQIHAFYDQMCPPCAEFNLAKRTETADLRGRVALLTGGRVKIGYQAGNQAAARRRPG